MFIHINQQFWQFLFISFYYFCQIRQVFDQQLQKIAKILQSSCMNQPLKPLPGYTYAQKIGYGSYSDVYKCIKSTTKEVFAVKLFKPLRSIATTTPKTEIDIVRKLDHPNIIKCIEVFKDQNNKYQIYAAVFQFCGKGNLQYEIEHQMESNNKLSESQAKVFIQKVLSALLHVHERKIVHRDITLANILLDDNQQIKLSGFTLSQQYEQKDTFQTMCGTPLTMAPQILDRKSYSSNCDTWSFGVISYYLLFCCYPFTAKSPSQLLENIKSQKCPDFSKSPEISEDAKEFLKACLTIDQEKRPSMKELKNFKWFHNSEFDRIVCKDLSSNKEIIIDSTNQEKIILKQTTETTIRSRLGHTTFSSDWQKTVDSVGLKVMERDYWRFDFSHPWVQIFSKIISTECKSLQIKPKQKSNSSKRRFDFNIETMLRQLQENIESQQNIFLLPMIVQITFPCLIELSLQDLNLLSIEPLVFLDMEKLKELNLMSNKITSIKPLNKQKWDSLDDLNFNTNRMRQVEIHRTKLSQNFGYLNFDHYSHNNFWGVLNQIQVQDISKVVKFQSQKIKRFIFSEVDAYLDQPVIIKKLKDRFAGINLITPDVFMMWS